MSRYAGNSEMCPACGLKYADLRTGFSYAEVFQMLWTPSPEPSDWREKRRGSVLGKWYEIKQGAWADHLAQCSEVHG